MTKLAFLVVLICAASAPAVTVGPGPVLGTDLTG